MAVAHSKLAVVKIDTSGGVLTDVSTYCNSASLERELEENDITTFGATSRQFIAGFANGSFNVGGPWSRESDTFFSAIFTAMRAGTLATVSFEYGPEGEASGDIKYSGELVMNTYSGANAEIDNPQEWEAEFRISGNLTTGTY